MMATIKAALPEDLDAICRIMVQARAQLRGLGLDQWQNGYPNREVWQEDIRLGRAYAAWEDGRIVGAFAFLTEVDPAYEAIDGEWLTGKLPAYASVHRVCVADGMKGKGIAGQMFAGAGKLAVQRGLPSVRIDTHPGNVPMQHAILKNGFTYCGRVWLAGGPEKGALRWAYEILI